MRQIDPYDAPPHSVCLKDVSESKNKIFDTDEKPETPVDFPKPDCFNSVSHIKVSTATSSATNENAARALRETHFIFFALL